MFGLLDIVKMAGAAVIAGAVVYPIATWQGASSERAKLAADAMTQAVETLRSRGKIDDEINRVDRVALCGTMGLSDADVDECVRRMEEAHAGTNDGG